MLAVIAIVYLLLALRVRVMLEGALCGAEGSFALSMGAAGLYLRFDGTISRSPNSFFPVMIPRYARKARKKKTTDARRKLQRIVKRYLWLAKEGRIELLAVQARMGLGDAAKTAMAAGVVRALISGLVMNMKRGAQVECGILPDADCFSFAVHVRCIFSCQAGDIMLAAVKAVLKKKHKSRERDRVGKASH